MKAKTIAWWSAKITIIAIMVYKVLIFPAPEEIASCACERAFAPIDYSLGHGSVGSVLTAPSPFWCLGSVTSDVTGRVNSEYLFFTGRSTCEKVETIHGLLGALGFLSVVLTIAGLLFMVGKNRKAREGAKRTSMKKH